MGTEKKKQPILLTIGMIFKNESRCLERCLKSLEPLRRAIPCELVMADTGSGDGSRETAARYADVLFDFPWTDDFSAARNAVMDRASGRWFLTVDADECLDPDITELTGFLLSKAAETEKGCTLVQRNYETYSMNGEYFDFMAMRLLRMSTGLRYAGVIHEAWPFTSGTQNIVFLTKTILHHDGYVNLNEKEGEAKRERNLALIRKSIAGEPENLKYLLQYLESGTGEKDYTEVLRRAVRLVEKKCELWEYLGPSVFRYAVQEARTQRLKEFEKWVTQAREWFPDSFLTQVDVEYIALTHSWEKRDYAACIRGGERYLKALEDYRAGRGDLTGLLFASFYYGTPPCEQSLKIYLADSHVKERNPKRAAQLLESVDCRYLDPETVENFMRVLWKVHADGETDAAPALMHFYEEAKKPLPDKVSAEKRMRAFYGTALKLFMYQEDEKAAEEGRSSHALFLPLGESCEVGLAALVMETGSLAEMERLLTLVQRWDRFPAEALAHAIKRGIAFPVPEKPLKPEEMDSLVIRLTADREVFPLLLGRVKEMNFSGNWQELIWNRKFLSLAVRTYNWKRDETPGASSLDAVGGKMGLARLYAIVEETFLCHYYAQEVLCGEGLLVLPAFDRFGRHYVQAFGALEKGNPAGFVQELKKGLHICPELTPMVEYLIKNTPQLTREPEAAAAELAALAEQVKRLLAMYPADDPAVAAIKKSEAYQKVAGMLEENNDGPIHLQ